MLFHWPYEVKKPAKLGPIFGISFLEEFSTVEREVAAGGL